MAVEVLEALQLPHDLRVHQFQVLREPLQRCGGIPARRQALAALQAAQQLLHGLTERKRGLGEAPPGRRGRGSRHPESEKRLQKPPRTSLTPVFLRKNALFFIQTRCQMSSRHVWMSALFGRPARTSWGDIARLEADRNGCGESCRQHLTGLRATVCSTGQRKSKAPVISEGSMKVCNYSDSDP